MPKMNLAQLQKNLQEVNYPLSKKDLILYAEEKGVDEGILRVMKLLPNKQYETPNSISEAINSSLKDELMSQFFSKR